MRLYVRNIWRAFPELDSFDDARCVRFVKAARGGRSWLQKGVHWGVQWAAFGAWGGAGALCAWMIQRAFRDSALARMNNGESVSLKEEYADITAGGVVLVIGVTLGLLSWLLVSHLFLRRRVARVLRASGTCGGCGYFLGGLPVDEHLRVVCPECELEATVDRSLGELHDPGDGAVRYRPTEKTVRSAVPMLKRAPVRRWLVRAGWAGAAVLVALTLAAIWNEARVRAQASRAAAVHPGWAALNVLAAKQLNGRNPGDVTNAFNSLASIMTAMAKAEAAAFPNGLPAVKGSPVAINGWWVAPSGGRFSSPYERDYE